MMTENMNVRLESNGGKEFRPSIEVPCMPAHLLLFVDVVPCFSFCREVLKLSRDFESLTANDEKSGASDAGHDASALENLLVQQFSLGSWIGSTTTPQMLPVAGPSSSAAHLTRSPSNGSILGYMVYCQNSFQKLVLLASNQFVHNHDDASEQS